MTKYSLFSYFQTSPAIIRLAVAMYVRFPLSLWNVEDLLHERGIDISHETVRFWWSKFGQLFASEIRKQRVSLAMAFGRWHCLARHAVMPERVFLKINGEAHYLWRAVDHEGEVMESFVTKRRDGKAAYKFLRKIMKRHGGADVFVPASSVPTAQR